jgi:hypothetical protein
MNFKNLSFTTLKNNLKLKRHIQYNYMKKIIKAQIVVYIRKKEKTKETNCKKLLDKSKKRKVKKTKINTKKI